MSRTSGHGGAIIGGTNLTFASSHNRRAVLEAIRRCGRLTRAEVARRTGLAPQTVYNIIVAMERDGLLECIGRRVAGRGQPAAVYRLNPAGGFSIGLQVDQTSILTLLSDLTGAAMATSEASLVEATPAEVVPVMCREVMQLLDTEAVDRQRIIGAGVAMPGPFHVKGLTSVGPTALPDWYGYSLAEVLSERLQMPVTVDNDATAAAIGEWRHGVARDLTDFAYIYVGAGLGAGLFVDGQPQRGVGRNAGEIGHMVIEPGGRECPCGNRGCLERYLSLDAAFEYLGWERTERRHVERLSERLAAGDSQLRAWLDSAAVKLGHALNILESVLDPEAILIGGPCPGPVLADLITRLPPAYHSVSDSHSGARIRLAATGRFASVHGAAALPLFEEFNPDLTALAKTHAE